ncbi:hypothetical protein BY457_11814 [Marinilabilia salmonicolor]|uniref:hypothetical protein n=1 Tax=Marinilabilia salmonicolor TaxID=989 RepID=UPI000D42C33B|nr:hypothetical protein [Marinilabilia salmonicolor]PRY95873.1 hypothetical protein BY457_11814 [Marinilabilia salmonicolor]
MILLFFFSCENPQIEEPLKDSQDTGIATFNNMLSFEDQSQFDNTINGQNINLTSVSGFAPLSGNLKSSSDSEFEDTLVVSERLSKLLNINREVKVGNTVYRVTPNGTFFADAENYDLLVEVATEEFNPDDYIGQNNISGLKIAAPQHYLRRDDDRIGVYDTYGAIGGGGSSSSSSTPVLEEEDFKVSGCLGTRVGKLWDSIWGFSKSIRNYYDSKYRMDAKFYSLDFGMYSEAGIKTKTQKKGWTGIWHKKEVDEIRCGFEVLILKEEWPTDLIPPIEDPTQRQNLPNSMGSISPLKETLTEFKNGDPLWTFNFWGHNISDKELAPTAIAALKLGIEKANEKWNLEPDAKKDSYAVRLFQFNKDRRTTYLIARNMEISSKNDDKVTYIFKKDFGGVIGYSTSVSNPVFKISNFSLNGAAPKYTYEKGTKLYGAARKGKEWRAVRFEF